MVTMVMMATIHNDNCDDDDDDEKTRSISIIKTAGVGENVWERYYFT